MRIAMTCSACGSDKVRRDAWAEWDSENQCWELAQVFDEAWCDNCDGPANIEEQEEPNHA